MLGLVVANNYSFRGNQTEVSKWAGMSGRSLTTSTG